MENTKIGLIPKFIDHKSQDDDDQSPTPSDTQNPQDLCGQSNVSHSSSTRYSTQCGYPFTINEKPDDCSNAKAQEAYLSLTWHDVICIRKIARCWTWARTQAKREHSLALKPSCMLLAQEQSKVWEQYYNSLKNGSTKQYRYPGQTHILQAYASDEDLTEGRCSQCRNG